MSGSKAGARLEGLRATQCARHGSAEPAVPEASDIACSHHPSDIACSHPPPGSPPTPPAGFLSPTLEFPGQMWAFLSDGIGIVSGPGGLGAGLGS